MQKVFNRSLLGFPLAKFKAAPLLKFPLRSYSTNNNRNNRPNNNRSTINNKSNNNTHNNNNDKQVLGNIFDIDPNAKYAQPERNDYDFSNIRAQWKKTGENESEKEGNTLLLYLLFGVNAVVFGLWHLDEYRRDIEKQFNIKIKGFNKQYMEDNFMVSVQDVTEDNSKPHTLITHMFSHERPLHFAFNMFALLSLSPLIKKTGSSKFLLIYLSSGFASIGSHILNDTYIKPEMKKKHYENKGWWYKFNNGYYSMDPDSHVLGASGAIYGLFSSSLFFLGARGAIFVVPLLFIDGYCYWNSLQIKNNDNNPSSSPSPFASLFPSNVSYSGHIGGAIAGFILGWILKRRIF